MSRLLTILAAAAFVFAFTPPAPAQYELPKIGVPTTGKTGQGGGTAKTTTVKSSKSNTSDRMGGGGGKGGGTARTTTVKSSKSNTSD